MRNLILTLTVLSLISVGLSGCDSVIRTTMMPGQPAAAKEVPPFHLKLDGKGVKLSERQALFREFMKKHALGHCVSEEFELKHLAGHSLISENRICFEIASKGIASNNYSKAGIYSASGRSTEYRVNPRYSDSFLSSFSNTKTIITQKFPDYVSKYSSFKLNKYPQLQKVFSEVEKLRSIEKGKVNQKAHRIKFIINDYTGLLPLNTKSELINNISITTLMSPLLQYEPIKYFFEPILVSDLEALQTNSSILQKQFTIKVALNGAAGSRFYITFDKISYTFPYIEAPSTIAFKVTNIKHNYIPKKFNSSNKSMSANLDGTTLNLTNKTQGYISINKISVYYNGEIFTRDVNVKMPPESQASHSLRSYAAYDSAYIAIKDKNKQVNFGYAVNYTLNDGNKTETLYRTKKYTVNSLIGK